MGATSDLLSIVAHLLVLLSFVTLPIASADRTFNVDSYGALADGKTDNIQAFKDAWKDACESEGFSTVLVPKGEYLAGPYEFKGPCKSKITFRVDGTILAPTNPNAFPRKNWIMFSYINQFKMTGNGIFDGKGKSAWGKNDRSGITFPTSLQFSFMNNSMVEDITSKDSKMFHIMILSCNDMKIRGLKIIAPEDSPNTDGIHIALSTNVEVTQTQIGTGDDCISIGPTNNGIIITDVECGPGHGISIGSLGKYSSDKDVSNVLVKNCKITKTTNGVRIKTWEHSFPLTCRNFTFENIKMVDVSNPIIIDQHYCPLHNCGEQTASKVKIIDMKFKNIEGTSETPLAINLKCSKSEPCADVHLSNINLRYTGTNLFKLSSEAESESESETPQSACLNVVSPIISGTVFPKACL